LKNNSHNLEEHKASEKMIMKKQFQSSTYPYSCLGLIIISYKDKYSFGTGCLIGPNLVLTAANNVYHKDTDDQPEVIHFVLDIN
jgi:V8-like Glu-specific endopeptidase